jgi:hypothetical protein
VLPKTETDVLWRDRIFARESVDRAAHGFGARNLLRLTQASESVHLLLG